MQGPIAFQYEVAISFLSQDESLALSISARLQEQMSVFVYSERQKQLAGTDGLESFRRAFLSDSRVVVVLYRQGWGQTRWTGVEQDAIKERAFDTGWDFLLVVTLDHSPVPIWIPKTHIRLDYARFGDQLPGAIKLRVQEAGGRLKVETALDKAQRIRAIEDAGYERQVKLSQEGPRAFLAEWNTFCQKMSAMADDVAKSIDLEYGCRDVRFNLNASESAISLLRSEPFPSGCYIQSATFIGRIALPTDQGMRGYALGAPQRLSEPKIFFDYSAGHGGWCWRMEEGKERMLSTDALADFLLQTLLQLNQDVKSGQIKRRGAYSAPRGGVWS